jgi:UDP-galactopyranose mutase
MKIDILVVGAGFAGSVIAERFASSGITEFKHLTGQVHTGTSIVREFPKAQGDPYYPVPTTENQALYQRYKRLADAETSTFFIGRLAEYRYYNMDQVVAAALHLSATHLPSIL